MLQFESEILCLEFWNLFSSLSPPLKHGIDPGPHISYPPGPKNPQPHAAILRAWRRAEYQLPCSTTSGCSRRSRPATYGTPIGDSLSLEDKIDEPDLLFFL